MFACGGCSLAFFAGTKEAEAVEYKISGVLERKVGCLELLFTGFGGSVVEELNNYATNGLDADYHIEENARADHNEPN